MQLVPIMGALTLYNIIEVKSSDFFLSQVYCKVSGNKRPEVATIDITSQEFYGVGYDDSDKRIPDMTIIKRQLGKHHKLNFA